MIHSSDLTTTRRVRDGGPYADSQWWLVSANDSNAQAGVQSMGRGLWAVWGFNRETRESYLDATYRNREDALAHARDSVLPAKPVEPTPESVHCGPCSSHIHHASRPVPGCHICGGFCQCLRPRTWFPQDRACTRGCGLPFAS